MKSGGIYIALGANLPLGDATPRMTLAAALEALASEGVELVARSSDWHSPAWPDPSDPPYVNAVAEVRTNLSADEVLERLLAVETRFGRQREVRWASRTLDLDLIDYRGQVRTGDERLILPHPRASGRAFVLLPLAEIAPDWTDPLTGQPIQALVEALPATEKAPMLRL
ncbi:2-amino-4-hydroxy-6-hydroxymethyldihydropteridine diphosphokinase [Maricaulis sp. CAU 1757]